MATRIRYTKEADDIYVGPSFHVLDNMYIPSYCVGTMTGHVNGTTVTKPANTTASLKRQIKKHLESLGVKFDSEVRRKRSQKQAIEKALEGKE